MSSRVILSNGYDSSVDGHGHVFPRLDGFKARCGGPAFCMQCQVDLETQSELRFSESMDRKYDDRIR